MTYEELKQTEIYTNADVVEVCVNGEDVDEEYFHVDEVCLLDNLPVEGTAHYSTGVLMVDLICTNWNQRFEEDWIPEPCDNK